MLNIINSIMYVLCVLVGYFLCYKFSNKQQEKKEEPKKENKIAQILKHKLSKKEKEEQKEKEEEFKTIWENINNYNGFESSQKG